MASIEVDLTANLSLTQAELFTVYALLIASSMGWRFQRRYDWNPLVVAVTLSLLLQGYRNYTAHPKGNAMGAASTPIQHIALLPTAASQDLQ